MDSDSASGSSDDSNKKRKLKKHKSKEKKHKKSSKKSKHRRRRSSSSDGSSSEEAQWVEAGVANKQEDPAPVKESVMEPKKKLQTKPEPQKVAESKSGKDEDEWSNFGNILPTYSNDSKRSRKQKEREEQRLLSSIDMAGKSDRELNPYWKDGGKGLPSVESSDCAPKAVGAVGDGGLAWLKKSFSRAKQQAEDSGKPLEEIVAERWGSLEAFYALLEEAENKARGESGVADSRRRNRDDRDRRASNFKRPSRYSDSEDEKRSSDREDRYSGSSSSRHGHHRDRDRHRDRERDRERSWRKDKSDKPPSWRKPEAEEKRTPVQKSEERNTSRVDEESRNPKPQPRRQEQLINSPEVSESDEEMDTSVPEEVKPAILTDQEMNALNAKLFKAELLGDGELVESFKTKLSEAQKVREEYLKDGKLPSDKPTKVITKIIMGQTRKRTRDKPTESHKEGQRIRYFPDDDRQSLKTMFEKEKMNTVEDENAMFSRLMAKGSKATEDYDVDDIFVDKASSSRQAAKDQKREIENVLYEEKAITKVLDDCVWCFEGKYLQKNLIISIGQTCYLCVPPYQSMAEGHCLIVPMSHVTCSTQLDEDVWAEIQKFRKALVRMFLNSDEDCVFFETAVFLKKQPHMYWECVPMPRETGELAPIYFKKAIQECETEWAQNKKVVDLRNRDVRKAVPKGLPYFGVEFGGDNCGFAHVIEDERSFPKNFAQEIIGGMMELDHQLWRKQKKEDFNKQREKLMKFLQMWGPYDFTKEENKPS